MKREFDAYNALVQRIGHRGNYPNNRPPIHWLQWTESALFLLFIVAVALGWI